ncbi:MAG: formyltransferase family protein [Candidatus Baltobacteraceae bacterium]
MNVLLLGPGDSPLADYLRHAGETVETLECALSAPPPADFLISYGYRHVVPLSITSAYRGRAINLHISLLPWNRGADPNFWSFLEGSPKGVTIHELDEGVDTGPVLAQAACSFQGAQTLRTSYETLHARIRSLFAETWPAIRQGGMTPQAQTGVGTFHRLRDKDRFAALLSRGWDTPVDEIERYGIAQGLRLTALP